MTIGWLKSKKLLFWWLISSSVIIRRTTILVLFIVLKLWPEHVWHVGVRKGFLTKEAIDYTSLNHCSWISAWVISINCMVEPFLTYYTPLWGCLGTIGVRKQQFDIFWHKWHTVWGIFTDTAAMMSITKTFLMITGMPTRWVDMSFMVPLDKI